MKFTLLTAAGPQLVMHDPGTWPSQANLAANDQWEALKSIQETQNLLHLKLDSAI